MAGAMLTMLTLDQKVDRYVAYEIDKYAVQTASHNFPMIEHRGDVIGADFTEFKGFDWVMAGFPCTKFSIAQKNDRETTPYGGEGWMLFEQAWRAVQEAQPKYILFENNKSMAQPIQDEMSRIIGFHPININSSLLSAQARNRIYWVGKRNPDGTYSQIKVEQPEDKKIMLKDILESGYVDREKSYCLKHQAGNVRDYFKKHHTQVAFEYVGDLVRIGDIDTTADAHRVYSCFGKARTLKANAGGQGGKTGLYLVPVPDEFVKDVCDKGLLYRVEDCKITTSHGVFNVNLPDGYYLIRKLTVLECKRLQTVPEWYDFSVVSDTQAYKMLGNGWTIAVIAYLVSHTIE